ncbi:MAG TPA: biotin carboxylase N-terminal domain-containing protein, partial [Mycobacteriales bacterium]|nr:biotin carboxylase N-terminal domain-containing protein [Mycobacteriales bacterium]
DADRGRLHTRVADEAYRIGPGPADESYLRIDVLVETALRAGAEAVHPGYGFLAENAGFAQACADAGLFFIGPPASAISLMGDKIRAKETVQSAGVPVVPGSSGSGLTDDELADAAREIGMPVLLKPSAGGGGKGMRVVRAARELPDAIAAARREARSSFGDDTLLVERYVGNSRHIEVQVLGDAYGNVIHLGERECSLQRRHQKVIEEAPSPLLDTAMRASMGRAAVEAARAVGYTGAGTVEFIVDADRPRDFFFLEMNTRLQVEHPVTELITGMDLVEQQVRIAAGERLPRDQSDISLDGHAIEARLYAEDPARGFLPQAGTVLGLREPSGPGVRVDSSLAVGTVVGSDYDPMLAKVIAWAPDRETARARLVGALGHTAVLGVATNAAFLRALLTDPDVVAGKLDTGLIERRGDQLTHPEPPAQHVFAAAALALLIESEPADGVADRWAVPDGWRLGEPAWTVRRLQAAGGEPVVVRLRGRSTAAEVRVGDGEPVTARAFRDGDRLTATLDGLTASYFLVHEGGTVWLAADGHVTALREHERLSSTAGATAGDGAVTSPMPGTVTVVQAAVGDEVAAGTPLLVVEAMKMEHVLTAPVAGTVTELGVTAGQTVALDERVAVVTPSAPAGEQQEN